VVGDNTDHGQFPAPSPVFFTGDPGANVVKNTNRGSLLTINN
jgi:hypothetical protein